MKKVKLEKVSEEEIKNLKTLSMKQVENVIKVGTKFHYFSWDHDVWHIINNFMDGKDLMIVAKSWSKYKKRWSHKVEYLSVFLLNLGWFGEIYKDADGNYYLKDNPKW